MTCDVLGPQALDYLPCHYGMSKLQFRGPARKLDSPYVAFLGGTVTYGRFVEQPYPLLVEYMTGFASVNLGQVNAGVDVFGKDAFVPDAAHHARATVLEVPGAINLSNRFYTVHPRRNDRFVRCSPLLKRLFPEVDFTLFSFTQHLVAHLYKHDPSRFALVAKALQQTWLRRMGQLLRKIDGPVVLLWLADTPPPDRGHMGNTLAPRFVTRHMLDALSSFDTVQVKVIFDPPSRDIGGKIVGLGQEAAAQRVPGPEVHDRIARALLPALDPLI